MPPNMPTSPPRLRRLLLLALLAASSAPSVVSDDGGGGGGGEEVAAEGKGASRLTRKDLLSAASYLRADDARLVRHSASDLTYERQDDPDGACDPSVLPRVLDALEDDGRHMIDRTAAAEIVALCAIDRPEHREWIAAYADHEMKEHGASESGGGGLYGAVVDLLNEVGMYWTVDPDADEKKEERKQEEGAEGEGEEEGEEGEEEGEEKGPKRDEEEGEEEKLDPGHVDATNPPPPQASSAAAAAAELIYALSFNSAHNVNGLVDAGAVEALGRIVTRCNPQSYYVSYHMCAPHVRMWSMAALQNLAASYCGGVLTTDEEGNEIVPDGRCVWAWIDSETLAVDEETAGPVTVDGSRVRERILKFGGLAEALVNEACLGSVRSADGRPNRDIPWPGEDAERGRDETKPSVVPWAAAGALKNLALSPEGREEARAAALCLCAMSASPDWLEIDKGETALYHMGMDDLCHFWTDVEGEDEDEDEENQEGEEAKDEEKEEREVLAGGFCVDYVWSYEDEEGDVYSCADYPDEETCEEYGGHVDEHGVDANEACCVCGGGDRVDDPEEVYDEDEDEDEEEEWQGDEF